MAGYPAFLDLAGVPALVVGGGRVAARKLEGLLAGLSSREQQVVRMRFGMGGAREHTLEEVGRAMSLTRERIRQIERVALDKLRARSERVQLKSYLER